MKSRSIARNIQRTQVIEGVLRGSRKGYAFLVRGDGKDDLFIPPAFLHGAQHKDRVAVKIITGDRAEVVRILERGYSEFCGTLHFDRGTPYVEADDPNYYSIAYLESKPRAKDGDKLFVRIVDYDKGRTPIARVIKVLGSDEDKETELLRILFSHGFSDVYPKSGEKCADAYIPYVYDGKRRDLRDLFTVTIDGKDAKDFDDAISLEKTSDGYSLYVHIADVSEYVKEGDKVDKAAYDRATSVYFPDKAYPMLPKILCNDLCSLREGEDRPTITVLMHFDNEGNKLSCEVFLSVIRSNHRLTYDFVQSLFDGECDEEYSSLLYANSLAKKIGEQRRARGSVEFLSREGRVRVYGEEAIPEVVSATDSTNLIEEFMIAANESVAEILTDAGFPCVYRVHELPDEFKLKQLSLFAACFISMPEGKILKPEELSEFISQIPDTEEGALINRVAIRSMRKAVYSPENIGHYGLASDCYCHFTSPIRRYPDLMVHRIVKKYLEGFKPSEYTEESWGLKWKSEHCSEMEREAERAERDADDFYKALYMKDHIGEEYEGIISGVTEYNIYVTLPNGIEGQARTDDLDCAFYFDELHFTLVSDLINLRLGDKVKIKVVDSDLKTHRVSFVLLISNGVKKNPLLNGMKGAIDLSKGKPSSKSHKGPNMAKGKPQRKATKKKYKRKR